MKVFVIITAPTPEDWGDATAALRGLHRDPNVEYVIIDNDCSPELEMELQTWGETLGAKVHRIDRTPNWKIISDVFTGRAAASITEPTLIADASSPLLVDGMQLSGLLGPVGNVSDKFVYTSNPVELMETLLAKTRGWSQTDIFAPATIVLPRRNDSVAPLENVARLMGVDRRGYAEAEPPIEMPPLVHPSLVDYYERRLSPDAARFLVLLQSASQLSDDFVDDDLRPEWRADAMRELLEILVLRLPADPFFLANQRVLTEAIEQCVSTWSLSNDLLGDPTPESRLWCFVQREAFSLVIWRVAVIVGGLEHGRLVLREIEQMLHGPHGSAKRFPAWLQEARSRTGREIR